MANESDRARNMPLGALAMLLVAGGAARGQAPAKLEFDVASMRASIPRDREPLNSINGTRRSGPGTADPGRISFSRVPLDLILAEAFNVDEDRISGPDWIPAVRYDIVANVAQGSTEGQAKQMLQSLLMDRLRLVFHMTTETVPGYELSVRAGGFKLKESSLPADAPRQEGSPGGPHNLDRDGFPILPPGVSHASISMMAHQHNYVTFAGTSIADFVQYLGGRLSTEMHGGRAYGRSWSVPARISDNTGLTGLYDFTFDWPGYLIAYHAPEVIDAIKTSLDKDLGLKLADARVPVSVLVIDHIDETPREN